MPGVARGRLTENPLDTPCAPARAVLARRVLRRILPAAILVAVAQGAVVPAAVAQEAKPPVPSVEQRVDTFVTQLDSKRKELGVVGAAIVVAHGDRIVRIAGLGQRSADKPEPVTEDTVFQIASVTKHFTAIAVALAVSEGKMAFEDHPRHFVPSFKLKDPEAD